VSTNVLSGAETTGVLVVELSESQGKSLYKADELYNTEGGQFKAKKKEITKIVLESINKNLGANCFNTQKGRQLALSVAQEISKLCGEEVSMACSINNVLIETVQKYLSLKVPLNPSMPEKFILPNVGTLLHYCFTLDAIRFNNILFCLY
jgi:hypothetical protein